MSPAPALPSAAAPRRLPPSALGQRSARCGAWRATSNTVPVSSSVASVVPLHSAVVAVFRLFIYFSYGFATYFCEVTFLAVLSGKELRTLTALWKKPSPGCPEQSPWRSHSIPPHLCIRRSSWLPLCLFVFLMTVQISVPFHSAAPRMLSSLQSLR